MQVWRLIFPLWPRASEGSYCRTIHIFLTLSRVNRCYTGVIDLIWFTVPHPSKYRENSAPFGFCDHLTQCHLLRLKHWKFLQWHLPAVLPSQLGKCIKQHWLEMCETVWELHFVSGHLNRMAEFKVQQNEGSAAFISCSVWLRLCPSTSFS